MRGTLPLVRTHSPTRTRMHRGVINISKRSLIGAFINQKCQICTFLSPSSLEYQLADLIFRRRNCPSPCIKYLAYIGQQFELLALCKHCPDVTYTWWTNTTSWTRIVADNLTYQTGFALTAGETYTFTVVGTELTLF